MSEFAEAIGQLMIARERVKAIDPSALSEANKEKRRKQLKVLRQATETLAVTEFSSLSEEAKKSAQDLKAGSAKLVEDLAALTTAISVINTVAAALGTITSFLDLVA